MIADHSRRQERETNDETPAKKQKLSNSTSPPPNIIKLTASPDGKHAVAVTEDKCVRVFSISPRSGALLELSERCMPKRPWRWAGMLKRLPISTNCAAGPVYPP